MRKLIQMEFYIRPVAVSLISIGATASISTDAMTVGLLFFVSGFIMLFFKEYFDFKKEEQLRTKTA